MREELFRNRNMDDATAEIVIERAINFGGFDFVEDVHKKKDGMKRFVHALKHGRNLAKKAVNYWWLKLGIDWNQTRTFQDKRIWEPCVFRG